MLSFFNENIGEYPYKQYSIIQGGDGGMEYPMCTLITGEREYSSLFGVTAMSWLTVGFTIYWERMKQNSLDG